MDRRGRRGAAAAAEAIEERSADNKLAELRGGALANWRPCGRGEPHKGPRHCGRPRIRRLGRRQAVGGMPCRGRSRLGWRAHRKGKGRRGWEGSFGQRGGGGSRAGAARYHRITLAPPAAAAASQRQRPPRARTFLEGARATTPPPPQAPGFSTTFWNDGRLVLQQALQLRPPLPAGPSSDLIRPSQVLRQAALPAATLPRWPPSRPVCPFFYLSIVASRSTGGRWGRALWPTGRALCSFLALRHHISSISSLSSLSALLRTCASHCSASCPSALTPCA